MDQYNQQQNMDWTNFFSEDNIRQSPQPGDICPLEYGITEGELENASLDEIKKLITASCCSWNEEQMLLQWRRTLKSRSYTKKCRDKNRCQVARLEQEKAALQHEAEKLKREIAIYQKLIQEMN
ncbi:hypothetical protein LOD99_1150 [Oopsacas minuta]|uniref:Basic leucine zipper domain-containing protein n=1 Tax=Oopsacas minuta TaxID=111878 RepID=A0AAV7K7Y8_9METZ|nr:hypothetical protein LOD99_1150 [Oopsacas minuta]